MKIKVDIDNTSCDEACNLEVTHKAFITYQPKGNTHEIIVKKDKFFLAFKNQQKS